MSKRVNSRADRLLRELKTEPESVFVRRGERMALRLFHRMAERVPAYKDVLKKHHIRPETVKTMADFRNLPLLDKQNYLKAYPRRDLLWDGKFSDSSWVISTTSGSTGEPYYFPRTALQDAQYARTAELYLRSNFDIQKKRTLYIDAFAMGAWIGGVFTYQAIRYVAERGNYPLSIITPGIMKKEVINAVRNLGQDFDQVIIGGYPPLVKDTIDDGIAAGLNWREYDLKFIFSAEGFTESFRDYIIEKTGLNRPLLDTLNHYGTVDLGTMAHETPVAILARRLLLSHSPERISDVFGKEMRLPTLAQYLPEDFYFEEIGSRLVCTAESGIPLVRYDLKDTGGVYATGRLASVLRDCGINLAAEILSAGISSTVWHLPFVYVHERSDFTVKLNGGNVYPDNIRKALQHKELQDDVTGKFTMQVKFDRRQDQFLSITVEMKSGREKSPELERRIRDAVVAQLLKENSEYRVLYQEFMERQIPEIILLPYEHAEYFRPGTKQKWVRT